MVGEPRALAALKRNVGVEYSIQELEGAQF